MAYISITNIFTKGIHIVPLFKPFSISAARDQIKCFVR